MGGAVNAGGNSGVEGSNGVLIDEERILAQDATSSGSNEFLCICSFLLSDSSKNFFDGYHAWKKLMIVSAFIMSIADKMWD